MLTTEGRVRAVTGCGRGADWGHPQLEARMPQVPVRASCERNDAHAGSARPTTRWKEASAKVVAPSLAARPTTKVLCLRPLRASEWHGRAAAPLAAEEMGPPVEAIAITITKTTESPDRSRAFHSCVVLF